MENDAGFTYLAIAYGVFFSLLAYYLGRLWRRDADLQVAVDELEARLGSPDPGAQETT